VRRLKFIAVLIPVFALSPLYAAQAEPVTVEVNRVDPEGVGDSIGTIRLEETDYGLLLTPDLEELPPGVHGFHVHRHGSCEPGEDDGETRAAVDAGGHYDPDETGRHRGPYGDGHKGDLPVLHVAADGTAALPVLAPRLELDEVRGRTVMIHEDGDNYADEPKKDGGGGDRIACGVIPE